MEECIRGCPVHARNRRESLGAALWRGALSTRRRRSTLFARKRTDVTHGVDSGAEGEVQDCVARTTILARQLFVNNYSTLTAHQRDGRSRRQISGSRSHPVSSLARSERC